MWYFPSLSGQPKTTAPMVTIIDMQRDTFGQGKSQDDTEEFKTAIGGDGGGILVVVAWGSWVGDDEGDIVETIAAGRRLGELVGTDENIDDDEDETCGQDDNAPKAAFKYKQVHDWTFPKLSVRVICCPSRAQTIECVAESQNTQ